MKIFPVRSELFHADRRTDRHDEAYSRFCNFSKATSKHVALVEVNASYNKNERNLTRMKPMFTFRINLDKELLQMRI
jgi:hypothetical protein